MLRTSSIRSVCASATRPGTQQAVLIAMPTSLHDFCVLKDAIHPWKTSIAHSIVELETSGGASFKLQQCEREKQRIILRISFPLLI